MHVVKEVERGKTHWKPLKAEEKKQLRACLGWVKTLVSLVRVELWQSELKSVLQHRERERKSSAAVFLYFRVFFGGTWGEEIKKRLLKLLWCCRIYFWSSTKANKGSNLSYLFGWLQVGRNRSRRGSGSGRREKEWRTEGEREGERRHTVSHAH